MQFSTNLPNYYYGPEYDRCARVVLLADKDEPVSQDLAKYPLDLEEKLVELWKYEAELKQKKSVFCVYRVKVAEDGAVEQCHLLKMPNDSWMLGQRDFKMEAAALALISANKKLLPLPPGSKSRYLFLSFSARRHSYEKSIIVYKSQTPAVKRFSDNVDKLVLSHWCPAPGESLDGTVHLEVVLDAKGEGGQQTKARTPPDPWQ